MRFGAIGIFKWCAIWANGAPLICGCCLVATACRLQLLLQPSQTVPLSAPNGRWPSFVVLGLWQARRPTALMAPLAALEPATISHHKSSLSAQHRHKHTAAPAFQFRRTIFHFPATILGLFSSLPLSLPLSLNVHNSRCLFYQHLHHASSKQNGKFSRYPDNEM